MTRIRFLLAALGFPAAAQPWQGENSQESPGAWVMRTFQPGVGRRNSAPRILKPANGECPVCGTLRAPITKATHLANLLKGNMGPYIKSQKWTAADVPDSLDVTCSYCRCHYSMDVAR